jgi:molybdopterin synthase sulfur carrier subunit
VGRALISIRVRFFASHREAAGAGQTVVELPDGATVRELREALSARLPGFAAVDLPSVVAVNGTFCTDGARLRAGDEVALFPPVSGG